MAFKTGYPLIGKNLFNQISFFLFFIIIIIIQLTNGLVRLSHFRLPAILCCTTGLMEPMNERMPPQPLTH